MGNFKELRLTHTKVKKTLWIIVKPISINILIIIQTNEFIP